LVIDDDSCNLEVIRAMLKILNLENHDQKVDYCMGAMEAIKKVKEYTTQAKTGD